MFRDRFFPIKAKFFFLFSILILNFFLFSPQSVQADQAETPSQSPSQAYSTDDVELARRVRDQDLAIDALYGQIVRAIVASADHTPEKIPGYLDVLSVAKNLERIADHATNIAEDVIFLSTGKIVRHRVEDGGR